MTSNVVSFELPWPPSVNMYWRRNGNRYFISARGIAFKEAVAKRCAQYKDRFKPDQKLSMLIEAYPPDKRKRDLDNITKGILDSLGSKGACVYQDDSQIDKLAVWRCLPLNGVVVVTICPVE